MASLSCALYLPTKCSSIRENGSINNTPQATSAQCPKTVSAGCGLRGRLQSCDLLDCGADPAKRSHGEAVDRSFRQGLIVEGGVRYRQTVVIRSYEVGPDKTATLETILNLLQETALNHVWLSGLLGDGFELLMA
ncbi:unnamed protein product [Musa acuminata var. zebrina]